METSKFEEMVKQLVNPRGKNHLGLLSFEGDHTTADPVDDGTPLNVSAANRTATKDLTERDPNAEQ